MDVKGRKVFVGLSGGVDSAVTAALLKDKGAIVTGVFIKGWYPPGMPCTWASDRRDATRVAAALGIPFHTLDASEEYKRGVIDYLLSEYKAGRTPNPDIMCNREVKFGAFARFAEAHDALIATGHYARLEDGRLLRGIDHTKDQSYFLWAVPKDALTRSLFPLGAFEKAHTRMLAKKYSLPVAEKKDSQGICFLGAVSVEDFLREEFGSEPGKAMDTAGRQIGTHDGALLHTLGSRVPLKDAVPGPWYVVAKDIEANTLTVAHELTSAERISAIMLHDANWLADTDGPLLAQYRYHGPLVAGALTPDRSSFVLRVALDEPLAPGQSLVLYRGEECIGGGIIS